MTLRRGRGGVPAPYALPAAFAALFAVGTVAAALDGRLPGTGVLIAAAVVVGVTALIAEPMTSVPLGVIGWLTVTGFSRPPYADLRPTGKVAADAAIVIGVTALGGAAVGVLFRWLVTRFTLENVSADADGDQGRPRRHRVAWTGAISSRRRLTGVALALAGLPLLTLILVAARQRLNFADDLLLFLLAVVTVTVVGGFSPAVLAAVASSLLLNWFLTPPLHTFTIQEPRNLLALVLFVTVTVAVSSLVHLAARRAVQAATSREETASLLALARTVLSGADTPTAVLDHLTGTLGGRAELQEFTAGRWIRVAVSGGTGADTEGTRIHPRPGLALLTTGQTAAATTALLAGFGAQAAAALDRERLRMQASQAEALAEGNRIRTALLAAVSHDLRTPLASIKASVSSLRQTDVEWTAADEADLLATIEQNADRLDALIGNLLDLAGCTPDRWSRSCARPRSMRSRRSRCAGWTPPSSWRSPSLTTCRWSVPIPACWNGSWPTSSPTRCGTHRRRGRRRYGPARPARRCSSRSSTTVPACPATCSRNASSSRSSGSTTGRAGVGLGLAVAKGFAEAMGGTIAAVDTPGGGLTIQVTMPVAHSDDRSVLGAGQ